MFTVQIQHPARDTIITNPRARIFDCVEQHEY